MAKRLIYKRSHYIETANRNDKKEIAQFRAKSIRGTKMANIFRNLGIAAVIAGASLFTCTTENAMFKSMSNDELIEVTCNYRTAATKTPSTYVPEGLIREAKARFDYDFR